MFGAPIVKSIGGGSTISRLDRQALCAVLGRPIGRDFDIVKRDTIDAVRCLRVSRPLGSVLALRGQKACSGLLPQPFACIPAERSGVVQVKYTDHASSQDDAGTYAFGSEEWRWFLTSFHRRAGNCPQVAARRQDTRQSCFFWIKSSARRAFGECLGSKRR